MSVIESSLRMVKAGTGAAGNSRTLTWRVKCSASTDSASNVYANDTVTPKRWDDPPSGHDIPSNFVCWTSSVQPYDESLFWFEITAEYISPPLTIFPTPLAYIAKGGGGADTFIDTDYDAAGVAITNTANDFVDPPFQKPSSEGYFWVEFRTLDLGDWPTRSHVMNSSIIWGCAARTIKTGAIDWARGIEDGTTFWQIRVPLYYRESTWVEKWKSRGFNYLDGGTKKAITLEDENGAVAYPSIPQPLTEGGAVASTPSAAFEIVTELLREEDMSGWGMPNPFDLED